jgi:hypothetical protein
MSTTETVAGAAGEASEKGMPQLNFATWCWRKRFKNVKHVGC